MHNGKSLETTRCAFLDFWLHWSAANKVPSKAETSIHVPCKSLVVFILNNTDLNDSLSTVEGVLISEMNVLVGKKTGLLFHGTGLQNGLLVQ